jgi:hypothetical protein
MKRFRNTKISREKWYRKLKPVHKAVWNFLCDECDEAGVWEIDTDTLNFHINDGEEINLEQALACINEEKIRVESFGENRIFIPGFVAFQYGELSYNCKPHIKIINLLKKYDLYDRVYIPYTKGLQTLQEKDKEEDKEKDKEEGGSRGKQKKPNIKPEHDMQFDEKQIYRDEVLPAVERAVDMGERKRLIADFIVQHQPLWIHPFGDLWNLAAQGTKLAQIAEFPESRLRKFNTRVREPAFDFLKILEGIRQSTFLRGQNQENWKADWDWIMANDTNYLKIIEGKYK